MSGAGSSRRRNVNFRRINLNALSSPRGTPSFAGRERWFMSLREGHLRPHYRLSFARGDAVRTVRLPPPALWAIAALAALSLAWTAAVTLYVVFHDDVMGAVLAHEAEMKAAYEDRLAEAQGELDQAVSRRLIERNAFKTEVSQVISRQARLEQRGAIVVALAAATGAGKPRRGAAPPDALSAIEALGPPTEAGASAGNSARAYAPLPEPAAAHRSVKPHPIDNSGESVSALPSEAPFTTASLPAAADNGDPSTRLAQVDRSLDRVENSQTKALATIDRVAERSASRDATIVGEAGLDPAKLSPPHEQGDVGGPYIPVEIDAHALALDPALTRVARDVATAERLKALLSFVPLRMPLSGEPTLTSSFGYRVDPFLGRLALHPGVDLAEPYGAEIHAAAAGRVVRAGPAGGYGIMVEIDHGNGLATRYAHMSEALVEEGEAVDKGAVLGKLGSTGRSTGPHLHYEVRVDGEPVDPERFLRAGADMAAAE